jgi:hypothetical protein
MDNIIDTANPEDRNYIDGRQKQERTDIALAVDPIVDSIVQLTQEKLPLQRLQLEQDGEIGPIKYVAEMIYGENAVDKIDNAARILILFIIFAFDPLAVLLLVASLGLIARKHPLPVDNAGNITIAADNIDTSFNPIRDAQRKLKRKYFPVKE